MSVRVSVVVSAEVGDAQGVGDEVAGEDGHLSDASFGYERNQAQIDEEALLDGIYVLRTQEPASRIGSAAVARAYKQLKVNEHCFREMKTTLEIRPVHHRLEERVRAHVFLCMLACYVQFELARRFS